MGMILLFFLRLFSPTYWLATWGKWKLAEKKHVFLKWWARGFAVLALCLLLLQHYSQTSMVEGGWAGVLAFVWTGSYMTSLGHICIILIPLSRCNEIIAAFLEDAFDKLPGGKGHKPKKTPISLKRRIDLALDSFFEIVLNFAVIYSILPAKAWGLEKPLTALDSLYYSVVTITTLGYGDFTPATVSAKILSVYEVLSGLVLIVLCLTIYMTWAGATNQGNDSKSEKS